MTTIGAVPAAPVRVQPPGQRGQRHDAALAVVVGAHEDADVLDRDDQRHRPEHQRDDPVDVVHRRAHRAVVDGEHGLQRVERAGADVAEDDAERGQYEPAGGAVRRLLGRWLRGCDGGISVRDLRRRRAAPANLVFGHGRSVHPGVPDRTGDRVQSTGIRSRTSPRPRATRSSPPSRRAQRVVPASHRRHIRSSQRTTISAVSPAGTSAAAQPTSRTGCSGSAGDR